MTIICSDFTFLKSSPILNAFSLVLRDTLMCLLLPKSTPVYNPPPVLESIPNSATAPLHGFPPNTCSVSLDIPYISSFWQLYCRISPPWSTFFLNVLCTSLQTLPEDLAVLSRSERLLSEPCRWYSCLDSSVQHLLVCNSGVADKRRLLEPKYCNYPPENDPTVGNR